ncbi:dephospho-CoA kinase [Bacteroidia bacterium]|nr:dephospho-CoA kinase [Bacteroidia bacterium]
MKVLGITGGIGSGKSVVSKILEINEIPVYNTDMEAKRLTETSPVIRQKLSERFGTILSINNRLDKKQLALLIFNNLEALAFVNSVIHPEVYRDFTEWKEKMPDKAWVGIESAILFETGFNRYTDFNLLITAPLELRIQRTQKRDGLTKDEILKRIQNQWPEEEKQSLVDFIVWNDERQAVLPQIENLFNCMSIT